MTDILNQKSLTERFKEWMNSPKADLRGNLITAVSEHEGWEESAVALVDEVIMPVIAERDPDHIADAGKLLGLLEPIADQDWHGKWRIQKALGILRGLGLTDAKRQEYERARSAPALKPEGQRTKAEEWEAAYHGLFAQLNPVMEENARLKRELVEVPDEDVEIAIAEAIAVMPSRTDYCEKGIPILKDLKKRGYVVMQKSERIEDGS